MLKAGQRGGRLRRRPRRAVPLVGIAMTTRKFLTDDDLPGLFQLLNERAVYLRRSYFQAGALEIVLGIVTAFAGLITAGGGGSRMLAGYITALVLAVLLLLYIRQKISPVAVDANQVQLMAEQVRSLAWRFAMKASPFDVQDQEAERRFHKLLDALQLPAEIPFLPSVENMIVTEFMRTERSLSLAERLSTYQAVRIEDILTYYSYRIRYNSTLYQRADICFLQCGLNCGRRVVDDRFPNGGGGDWYSGRSSWKRQSLDGATEFRRCC
jgi:SMODS and SLOG-associating 2TM effector domain 3